MASLYESKNKFMMSEGLYRQAIENIENAPQNVHLPLNLAGAKYKFGNMLLKVPKRENEGK